MLDSRFFGAHVCPFLILLLLVECIGSLVAQGGEESTCQCGRPGFDPWVGKIPWRREWQPTPVFSPGESHGQRSLGGLQPVGSQRVGQDRETDTFFIV